MQVYEASCDACSRCLPESQPEMLKSINGLMDCYTACDCTTLHTLSPAAPDKASEPLSPSTPSAQCHTPPTGSNITTPSLLSDHLPSHSASQGHGAGQSRRREEMVAAWLLFCSASDASLASRLRSAHVQQARETPPLRFVLCWLSAASRGDFYACLHAVHDAPTPLLQRLLTWRAVQVCTRVCA